MRLMGPWLIYTVCIIFLTMHNAVKFYHFFHCTVENLLQCSAVETPGTEGIIFSSGGEEKMRRGGEEERRRRGEEEKREEEERRGG